MRGWGRGEKRANRCCVCSLKDKVVLFFILARVYTQVVLASSLARKPLDVVRRVAELFQRHDG